MDGPRNFSHTINKEPICISSLVCRAKSILGNVTGPSRQGKVAHSASNVSSPSMEGIFSVQDGAFGAFIINFNAQIHSVFF